jgi:hypothetical protein
MSIHGHKGFQFSQAVTRTDVAYPDLWVAPGSRDTRLGRGLAMDDDFVLGGWVCVGVGGLLYVWMWWRGACGLLRGEVVCVYVQRGTTGCVGVWVWSGGVGRGGACCPCGKEVVCVRAEGDDGVCV